MSVKDLIEASLLGVVVLSCWAGALGAWRMKEPMQGLHYCTIPATAGMGAVTAAVFLATGSSAASWKTAFIFLVLVVVNAVGMHASGRAFRARDLGHWEPENQDVFEWVPNDSRTEQE